LVPPKKKKKELHVGFKPTFGPGCPSPTTFSPVSAIRHQYSFPSPLSFNNLGIQCVRKKEIEAAIERKIQLGIDPYNGEPCALPALSS
jgi:hypothetical protein